MPKIPKKGTSAATGAPLPPAAGIGTPVVSETNGAASADVRRRLCAIDPGDVHVGVAEFIESDDDWECVQAYEMGWEGAIDRVASFLVGGQLDVLVVESFRLYADEAKAQIGSEMQTAQCIGAIRYLHAKAANRQRQQGAIVTELAMQPASIQKATRAILKAKGVLSESNGNPHALSAELHGWHWILRHEGNTEAAWSADGE